MNKEQVIITSVEIRPPVVTFADMSTEMKEFAFERAEYAYSKNENSLLMLLLIIHTLFFFLLYIYHGMVQDMKIL